MAETERRSRQRGITAALQYYAGDQWHPLRSTDGVDHNTIVNLCRQAVDRTVAFLFPKMPRLELVEGQDTASEQALNKAWEENGGASKMSSLALSGSLSGHVFARVAIGNEGPRVINLDPRNVLTYWPADDVEQVLWYEIQWEAPGGLRRQDIARDGDGWLIVDWFHDRRQWVKTGEASWNHPLGPIVDWQHLGQLFSYYGRGEIDGPARTMNDRLNSVASDVAKILHHHGSPRTVATGTKDINTVESGPDRLFTIPNPQARVYNLEMQSDLGAAMGFVQLLERTFFGEQRVVRLSGDVSDMQRVTNLGIRALYIDQIAKTEDLRRRYEWGIQEISRRFLWLLNAEDQRPAVHWPDPLPQDTLDTVEFVERVRAMGLISPETQANRLGLDLALEMERASDGLDVTGMQFLERLAQQPGFGVSGRLAARQNGDGAL